MTQEVNIKQAEVMVEEVLRAGLVPMIHGSPGI